MKPVVVPAAAVVVVVVRESDAAVPAAVYVATPWLRLMQRQSKEAQNKLHYHLLLQGCQKKIHYPSIFWCIYQISF